MHHNSRRNSCFCLRFANCKILDVAYDSRVAHCAIITTLIAYSRKLKKSSIQLILGVFLLYSVAVWAIESNKTVITIYIQYAFLLII